MSKIIYDCIGSPFICLFIGLEILHKPLDQSDVKLKSIATLSSEFSRASSISLVFSPITDWPLVIFFFGRWLAVEIISVLVLRHSFEKRSSMRKLSKRQLVFSKIMVGTQRNWGANFFSVNWVKTDIQCRTHGNHRKCDLR